MKNSALTVSIILIASAANAQQEGAFEQYYYIKEKEPVVMMPIAHYQTKSNWYTEARFNYEDLNTFSIYAGKIFSRDNKLSYSIIPILGGVMGKFQGGSLGVNLNVEYKHWFLSSQSQYTFSSRSKASNFYYSWSEAGYEIWNWLYVGAAVQYTRQQQLKAEMGPGVVIGLSAGNWTFPLYGFNIMDNNRYFLLGINKTLK